MSDNAGKQKILFVCERNAGRSQMAEGFCNAMFGDRVEAHSAGIVPATINPLTVRVMEEAGIDISHQVSKTLSTFHNTCFDRIFIMCDWDYHSIPELPCSEVPPVAMHIQDPKSVQGGGEEVLMGFRVVRDAILTWLLGYFGSFETSHNGNIREKADEA